MTFDIFCGRISHLDDVVLVWYTSDSCCVSVSVSCLPFLLYCWWSSTNPLPAHHIPESPKPEHLVLPQHPLPTTVFFKEAERAFVPENNLDRERQACSSQWWQSFYLRRYCSVKSVKYGGHFMLLLHMTLCFIQSTFQALGKKWMFFAFCRAWDGRTNKAKEFISKTL